ncbi:MULTISPECIES: hypothetical protein [Haloarcula]|uniref:hypothetical protein n=1 Tax=Haloarcula TaxID=2237 RepID=UPI0023EB0B97|nr:hypothetical protein [Halomicroarcula sp. XH51]
MLHRARENGPVVLVPLAWTFATAAHLDVVTLRTVLIAHLVMDAILVAFTALSWGEMSEGVLRAWKLVLLAGLGATLVGTAGLLATPPVDPLLSLTVVAWMLIPAAGLAYTGQHVAAAPWVYSVGAILSVAGAVVYAGTLLLGLSGVGLLAGLTATNVGQTAGIANAVYQY